MTTFTSIARSTRSARTLLAAAAVAALVTPALAITPVPFTANNPIGGAPVGFTFAGNKFIGSVLGDGTNRLYSTDLTGGSIQAFGGSVNLAPSFGFEHYVSASFGLGGFPANDVYVAEGNNVRHITNAGVADPLPFINSGSFGTINGDVRGIMFDTIGTWGYQMLITTHTGYVYSVDPSGNFTPVAYTGEDTEGLDIAPTGPGALWGGKNGWLFVASEGSGSIRAIDFAPAHTMVTMGTVSSAEQLSFVPLNLGASGSPLEGMYSANYNKNVLFMDDSQFAGLQGQLVVTGETTSIVSSYNASFSVTDTGTFSLQPEDGIFVTAAMVPEPATLGLLLALAGPALLVRRRRA